VYACSAASKASGAKHQAKHLQAKKVFLKVYTDSGMA
jgi:hypothetical protein